MTTPTSRVTKKCAALAAALAVHCQGIVVNCDVQARLDGLHQAVYEERDRLLDAINEAEAHARARMLQLRGRVMNNDFDIDPALHHVHLLLRVVAVCSPFAPELEVRLHLLFYGGRHVVSLL